MDTLEFKAGIGSVYAVVISDGHSKNVIACELYADRETINAWRTLVLALKRHGKPTQILTNGSRQFTSHMFREYLKRKGVEHVIESPPIREIEDFERTIRREMPNDLWFMSLEQMQNEFDRAVERYNERLS